MNAEIQDRLPQIEELCRRHGVTHLELFGSATGPSFDPDRSDFDFLAEFEDRGTQVLRVRAGISVTLLTKGRSAHESLPDQEPVSGTEHRQEPKDNLWA